MNDVDDGIPAAFGVPIRKIAGREHMAGRDRVSVRALAEFALERGDLMRDAGALDRMLEGAEGHRLLQSAYVGGFKSEVGISLSTEVDGRTIIVYGRIDGLNEQVDPPIVEEIKTTRLTPGMIGPEDFPVHWAQAELYAHMLAEKRGYTNVLVRLVYVNLNGDSAKFERTYESEDLRDLFLGYARPYAQWLSRLDEWQGKSRPTMRALAFPFGSYRDGQRDMAAAAYRAIRARKNLIASAPTGIGKTAAALFPAVKALGEGLITHIFYLTARGTQRRAAEDALERMRAGGLVIRSVAITAKEKACPFKGIPCDPAACPRAAGYYDRRRDALNEALKLSRLDEQAIAAHAEKWALCPFELSLDLSEQADVIVCDYNYAFDPRVRLKRFFLDKGEYALLIDEAHHLPERAREMLSARVSQADFANLRKAIRQDEMARGVYEALGDLIKAMKKLAASLEGPSAPEEPPESLYQPMADFLEAARPLLPESLDAHQLLYDRYFEALDYLRVADAFTKEYRALLEPEGTDGKALSVKLWCFDPANALRAAMGRVRSCVLFSATLSPIDYYLRASGLSEADGDEWMALDSPFPRDNLLAARFPVDTRYSARERTAPVIARALKAMCEAKSGNYLACFPSYEYLNLTLQHFLALGARSDVLVQRGGMTDAQRAAFLERFTESPRKSMMAFVVMGGVFAEGVDLPGEKLIGAAIVGVGIPQPSFERETLRALSDDDEGEGFRAAYVYPGIKRVLQAAGRVIRTETDRGVVLLLDERYQAPEYRKLLPPHWRVRPAADEKTLQTMLRAFWNGEEQGVNMR